MQDEFKAPSDEIFDMVEKRLVPISRMQASQKHTDLMHSLYAEHMNSMGRLTERRVKIIIDEWSPEWQIDQTTEKTKNVEQPNITNHTLRTAKTVKDHVSLHLRKNAPIVKL